MSWIERRANLEHEVVIMRPSIFLKDIFMFRVRYFLSPRLVASPSDFAFSVWSGKPQVLDLMVDPIFSVITIGPSGFCQRGRAPLLS